MNQFVRDALGRTEGFLKLYGTDEPCELLADVIHYCRENNIDWRKQVSKAQSYVTEELSYD
jgi:hypothetical protein